MVNFLLGQQSGYTKYACFICMWDSRARQHHWNQDVWPVRDSLTVGKANIIREPLVSKRDKIILPPLHINNFFTKCVCDLCCEFVALCEVTLYLFNFLFYVLQFYKIRQRPTSKEKC